MVPHMAPYMVPYNIHLLLITPPRDTLGPRGFINERVLHIIKYGPPKWMSQGLGLLTGGFDLWFGA